MREPTREQFPDRTVNPLDGPAIGALYLSLEHTLLEAHVRSSEAEARRDAIDRAEAIVFRLGAELDLRLGGELARRLAALYGYLSDELRALRGAPDEERMEELLELAVTLRLAAEVGRAA